MSLLGIVHTYERYDLLLNVEKAARLTWVHWDKYVQPPDGSISTTETYVARHKVMNDDTVPPVGFTHYIGKYDPSDKLGSITYVKVRKRGDTSDVFSTLIEHRGFRTA